jgi:hypothetical protein
MGKSSCCNMIRKTRDEDTGFYQQLKCLYKVALLIIVDFDSVSLSPEMFRFHRAALRSAAAARGDKLTTALSGLTLTKRTVTRQLPPPTLVQYEIVTVGLLPSVSLVYPKSEKCGLAKAIWPSGLRRWT